jgi:hypothetical protein
VEETVVVVVARVARVAAVARVARVAEVANAAPENSTEVVLEVLIHLLLVMF